jgi:hypothetical protein
VLTVGAVLILIPVISWLWMVIFRPIAPCRWCRGRKRVGTRKRWRERKYCKHCGDTGKRMVLGSGLFHGDRGRGK